jgi:uncharacterized protein (DUF362 family)
MITRIHTAAASRLPALIREELRSFCGDLRPRCIVLKPNWVMHETDPAFPIRALVTDARVITATAEACLELFPNAESILIGDCPLQSADWPKLCQQSGLTESLDALVIKSGGKIAVHDLRKEVFEKVDGSFLVASQAKHGDPAGYRTVALGKRSHLEALAKDADRFAVNDYSASVTSSNHQAGSHNYFVSQSVLNADLFINLPKWKAHAKSGITGALKNLVGINADKAFLPHFRRGAPKWGGDEYADRDRWIYWTQTTLRESLQKRSRLAFKLLKPGWEVVKKLRSIETRMDSRTASSKNFYVAGGAWYGNDTLWRMIYDINLVIQCVNAAGQLADSPQRHCISIVDGLVSGEGNGPLQPLPRETDWLLVGDDPFAIDATLCHFMGFNPARLPLIARRKQFAGVHWGQFDQAELEVDVDGHRIRVQDSPVNFAFLPPPGWRGHIER